MRIAKWLGIILAIYVILVIVFEAGVLGLYQPSFEDQGIPMLVITTTDDSGEPNSRMLANFRTEDNVYVSAHHWTRGWYHRAVENPSVRVEIYGVVGDYTAVPVTGEEFERVATEHPIPLPARILMGLPPPRDILRLDPVEPAG